MNTPIPTPIKFFDTKTRIGRLRYFAYPIGLLLLVLPVFLIAGISFAANLKTLGVMLIALAYLFMIIMQIIFMIRRLHDMNTSGWWCLIYFSFIPFLILVGMHLLAGVLFFVYVVLMLANLVFVLILLFYPGTKDENRFGPPPPANSGWVIAGAWSYLSVFFIGILAAIAIPQYQDYIARAQMAEAVELSNAARHQVHLYFIENKQWPQTLGTVYAPAASSTSIGRYVDSLQGIISPDGAYGIVATMKTDEAINFGIRGKALEIWSRDGGKSWWCGPASTNPVDIKYVPAVCRDTADARP